MADPTTPLPESKAFGQDERSVLLGYLDYHRKVLARKAEGVTDEQGRLAACPPSDLTLLGLIRHMAEVERGWFRQSFMAEDVPMIFGGDDADFHPLPDATLSQAWLCIGQRSRLLTETLRTVLSTTSCEAKPIVGGTPCGAQSST